MGLKLIRRLLLMRLALSFIIDYWRIQRVSKNLHGAEQEEALIRIYTSAGKRMKHTAFRLKGIIVKVGQFLSMRQDVLPQVFTKELEELQDSLPAAPFSAIRPILEQEIQGKLHDVFKSFDEPAIAAASLAQVHKAVLLDGSQVAVKILRPRMEKLAQADLDTLGFIAKVVQRVPALTRKMNFVQLHHEFTETIQRELDCRQESANIARFTQMYANHAQIKIPKVYHTYTSQRLLIMEYVEGARINEHKQLEQWGVNCRFVAETLLEAYLLQFLVHGFVHLDPHPGNLFVLSDHRLCFIDFGMVQELTKHEVVIFRKLLQSIGMQDLDGILSVLEELGFLPKAYNRDPLKNVLELILGSIGSKDSLQHTLNIPGIVTGLRSFLEDVPIQLQAEYMFIIRCIGILITTLTRLAPNTDWFEILFKVGPNIFSMPIEANK